MKKNTIYKIVTIIFLVAFLICMGMLIKNFISEQKAQKKIEELKTNTEESISSNVIETVSEPEVEIENEIVDPVDPLEELGIIVPEKKLDWEKLENENKDIYAWIYIPNTIIDYPILQHENEDSFYLRRDLDGNKCTAGCIYSEHTYNNKDFMDFNTLLYGHNMRNGTMFNNLHKFEDSTFFDENRYIYIYTKDNVLVYDIFAAYVTGNHHILAENSGQTETQRQIYLDELFGIRDMSAHFRKDVEVDTEDHILTLVTCVKGKPDNRYFVQGVLINPPTLY